jgi:multiple sugar transport system substrate-binding protein
MSQAAFVRSLSRRSVIKLLSAASTVPLLAACAGSGATGGTGQNPAASGRKPVTLRWSPWDGEGQAIVQGANKGVETYTKAHPWVTIEFIGQTGDFNPKIDSMIAAGDGPEVFGGNGAVWRERANQGQFLNLDPYIKKDFKAGWKDDYVSAQIDFFNSKESGQWSLPMYLGTFGLYYNKSMFRERGVAFPDESWDWNKWADAMQKLTVRPDKFGADFQSFSRSRAMMMILQNGGHMVDPKDDTVCVVDQPPALEALQWISDRWWKDHTAIQRPELQGRNATALFGSGTVAMIMDGSFRVAPIAQEVPAALEWDVAPFPKGKVKRSVRATTDGWAVYRGAKLADDAWDFFRWLQSDEWYEIMMGVVGLTPARVSQQDKWVQTVFKAYPALAGKNIKIFTDAVKQKYAEPEEFFRFHKDGADIVDAAYNDSVRDNKSAVAPTMKEAAQRVTAIEKQKAGK